MKKSIFKPFVLLCLVFAVACNQDDLFREDPEYSELTEMQLSSHTLSGVYRIKLIRENPAPDYAHVFYRNCDKYIEFDGAELTLYYVLRYTEFKEDPNGPVMSNDGVKYSMNEKKRYYRVKTEDVLFYEIDGNWLSTNFLSTPFMRSERYRFLKLAVDSIILQEEDSTGDKIQLTPVRDGVLLSSLSCGDVATFDEIKSFWEEDHIVD